MKHRLSTYSLWSAFFLFSGTTVLSASERITPEVMAVKKVRHCVGNIHTEKSSNSSNRVFEASEKAKKVNGMGTGVIIDERGYLVTNYHVVADVDTIKVEFEDENHIRSSYTAEKVQFDPKHDLAIIKIKGIGNKTFKVMPVGTSSDLMLVEKVIAIGNAYGYVYTATLGCISALNRDVEADTVSYKNLIQTDAAINPGNSGGPLINIDGEVIGINVAIRANANRIGFAIPIDDARKAIKAMMNIELMDQNYHGLVTKDHKSGQSRMLVVEGFQSDSPAAMSGLRSGDVIVRAGHVEVTDGVDFERGFLHRPAGDRVEVTFKRNDKLERTSITIAPFAGGRASLASSEVKVSPRANDDEADRFWPQLGLRLTTLTEREMSQLIKPYHGGMKVLEVKPDSPAAANGIKKGDILVGLGSWETLDVGNITWILNHFAEKSKGNEAQTSIPYLVVRTQQRVQGNIQLATKIASLPN